MFGHEQAIVQGVMGTLLGYHVLVSVIRRSGLYAWFSACLGILTLLVWSLDKSANQSASLFSLEFPNPLWLLAVSLFSALFCQLTRLFLRSQPFFWLEFILTGLILMSLVNAALWFVVPVQYFWVGTLFYLFVGVAVLAVAGTILFVRGSNATRCFLLVWLLGEVLLADQILRQFVGSGFLPILPGDLSVETALFSFLLACVLVWRERELSEERPPPTVALPEPDARVEPASKGVTKDELEEDSFYFLHGADGFFAVDANRRFLRVNPAFARWFGYSDRQEMLASVSDAGTQCFRFSHDYEALEKLLHTHGEVDNLEMACVSRDGESFWANCSASLDRETGIIKGILRVPVEEARPDRTSGNTNPTGVSGQIERMPAPESGETLIDASTMLEEEQVVPDGMGDEAPSGNEPPSEDVGHERVMAFRLVDLDMALRNADNSERQLEQFLVQFLNEQCHKIEHVEKALREGDYPHALDQAVLLGNAAERIGAGPLGEALATLRKGVEEALAHQDRSVQNTSDVPDVLAEMLEVSLCDAQNAMEQTLTYIRNRYPGLR